MARPKNPRNALLHLIDQADQPVYLLDADSTLVYLNSACERWLGAPADGILGLKCQPSSIPLEHPELNLLRGLVPASMTAASLPGESLAEVFAVNQQNTPDLRVARVAKLGSTTSEPPPSETSQSQLVFVLPVNHAEAISKLSTGSQLAQELRRTVAQLLAEQPAFRDLPGIVGRHPLTWRLRRQLESACELRTNILIQGDERSLPELFARTVCTASRREAATWPTLLDGRMIDEEQLTETLKSLARRITTDQPNQACLLVTRAESMPAAIQPQLRDWLASQGQRLRVVATSNQSLLELARQQAFDFELATRLATTEIQIPRLSERRSDIPAIATHWLEHYQASRHAPPISLSNEVIEQLLEFNWTGDLDQLRTVLLQAAAKLPAGGQLLTEHLPEVIRYGLQAQRIGRPIQQTLNLDEYLGQIERLILERALQQSGMNKAQAARLLGMTRQRFLRRCEHWQLSLPEEPIDFRPADDFEEEADGNPLPETGA